MLTDDDAITCDHVLCTLPAHGKDGYSYMWFGSYSYFNNFSSVIKIAQAI